MSAVQAPNAANEQQIKQQLNNYLWDAARAGDGCVIDSFIAAKYNPDTRNNAGQTAAMYAALFQRHALLEQLKAKGADMRAIDTNGNNVVALARGEINGH